MPRHKRQNIKRLPPIDLNMDNPRHKALWDYYQGLTAAGNGAEWVRGSLIAMLPAQSRVLISHKTLSERTLVDVDDV